MRSISIFIMCFVLAFTSCVSAKGFEGKYDLYGMINSFENIPVEGYEVSLKGRNSVMTNMNGMFVFHNVSSGRIRLNGEKEGWQNFELEENFADKRTVFCIQIKDLNYLLNEVEIDIDKENYLHAQDLLNSTGDKNKKNNLIVIYKAVADYKLKKFDCSVSCLRRLKKEIGKERYDEIFLLIQKEKKEEIKNED